MATYNINKIQLPNGDICNTSTEIVRLSNDSSSNISNPYSWNLPAGGTAGQVLKKASSTDYDVEWTNELYAANDYTAHTDVDFWGANGFVSNSQKNLWISIPFAIPADAQNIIITKLTIGLRAGTGGYVGGADHYDVTSQITDTSLIKSQGILLITCASTSDYLSTNNVAVCGNVVMSYQLSK